MFGLFKPKSKGKHNTPAKPGPENTCISEGVFILGEQKYFIDGKPASAREYADCLAQHDVRQINSDYGLSYDGSPETECFADEDE